jgi:hypothetical protein
VLRTVAVGSSGTYGFKIARTQTWPAQLEQLCRARGKAVEVASFASPGLPLGAYAERLLYLRTAYEPDLVVIQLPPCARTYLGINGTRRLGEEGRSAAELFGWAGPLDSTTRVAPTRIHLNQLLAVPGSPFFHLLEPWFYPRVADNNEHASWDQFLSFARFWADNVADSDLQHVQHGKEIVLLQMLLERWKVPYLMFDWHVYNSRLDARLGSFSTMIDFSRYVGGGTQTASGFVKGRGGTEQLLDSHGHLTPEGHRDLAEHFLLPAFERILEIAVERR